jgi:hypothetical protein
MSKTVRHGRVRLLPYVEGSLPSALRNSVRRAT